MANDDTLLDVQNTPHSSQNRSWFQRTFGPMKKGSLRTSVILLTTSAMGSGMLGIPLNASNSGFILELIILFLCAFVSLINLYLLMEDSFKTGINSYNELVEFAFGNKAKIMMDIIIVIYCFGVIVGFQIAFAEFVWEVIQYFSDINSQKDTVMIYIKVAFIAVNVWISLLRNLNSLRYFQYIGLASIILIVGAITVNLFLNINNINTQQFTSFTFDINIFSSFAGTFYCFICHLFVFMIKQEIQKPTLKRLKKVSFRAVEIQFALYLIVIFSGYFQCFSQCPDLVINYFHNLTFTVMKIILSLPMFFAVPLNLQPARQTLIGLMKKEDSKFWHIAITIFLQGLSGLLAIVYPKISSFFGFLGGFFGCLLVVAIPLGIHMKLSENRWSAINILRLIFSTCIITLGFGGAIISQLN